MNERDLPTWSEGDLNNPSMQLQKLRQMTEAMQRLMGTRDQAGTGLSPGWYTRALSGAGGGGIGGGSGGLSTDNTPPPVPTGLAASGGLSTLGVVWDAPIYTQGGGNAYTVIYGAKWVPDAPGPNPKPTFANAVQLGSVPGRSSVMFIATEPNTYWCIWAVFVTTAGVSGQPGGGTNGAQAQTGQDPSVLLDLLTGQITASELHSSLSRPIELIGSTINQIDSSWWAPGAVLQAGWSLNGSPTENAFVSSFDHTGKTATLWRCTSEDPYSPEPDGGWNATLPALDRARTYRFMIPVRKNAGSLGHAYWGFYGGGSNPYFSDPPLSVLASGEWHWMVGFVYGIGVGADSSSAGTYKAATGEKVYAGGNFNWDASTPQAHRAYLYYAEAGAQIDFGRPLVHLVDGNEPPLDAIIRGTAGAVAAAQALVTNETTARQAGDTALANSITTLSATVGSNAAAIQEVAEATADLEGHVAASYSVRAQVTAGGRTAVGGFGLTGEVGASGPTITFGVVANQFWVGAPNGTPGINADILPFFIQTSPVVINGVTIPAGVYMDAAYINNLTALVARLGTAWIDNAMIANLSAGKITSGALQVGEYIQNTGYVPGASGWLINGDGSAEFGAASIRGQLTASQINTNGLTIRDTNGNLILGSGTALDTSYAADGTLNSDLVPSIASAATTANWSGIIGSGKPQDGATVGATFGINIDGKITSANASTFIANAAIGGVHIGAAEIDTLNVKGGAITAPAGWEAIADLQLIASGAAYETVLTLSTVDTAGNQLYIAANFDVSSSGSVFGADTYLALFVGETKVWEVWTFTGFGQQRFTLSRMLSNPGNGLLPITFRTRKHNFAASATFTVHVQSHLAAIGCKR